MSILVPYTPDKKTWSCPFESLYQISKGPDIGSSMLIYFNDRKGAPVDKQRSRMVDGPSISLVQKLEG